MPSSKSWGARSIVASPCVPAPVVHTTQKNIENACQRSGERRVLPALKHVEGKAASGAFHDKPGVHVAGLLRPGVEELARRASDVEFVKVWASSPQN